MTGRLSGLLLAAALLGCAEDGIGTGRHAECRRDKTLFIQANATCPGAGTEGAPFCSAAQALALVHNDLCPAPWTIKASGTFHEALVLNQAPLGGDTPRSLDVTVKGGTFGGEGILAVWGNLVQVGVNVTLALEGVTLSGATGNGIVCSGSAPQSLVRLRSVSISQVRNAVRSHGCAIDAEQLRVHSAFGALEIREAYRLVDVRIEASASWEQPLLAFDDAAAGTADGLTFRDNLTRYGLIACGAYPRVLSRLDIRHREPLFPGDPTHCVLENSRVETIP